MTPSERFNTLTKLTYRITPKLKVSLQFIDDNRWWKSYVHSYKYNPDGTYNYFRHNTNLSVKVNQSFGSVFYAMNAYRTTTDYKYYVYEDPKDPRYVSSLNILGTPGSPTFVFGGTQMGRHELKTGFSIRND